MRQGSDELVEGLGLRDVFELFEMLRGCWVSVGSLPRAELARPRQQLGFPGHRLRFLLPCAHGLTVAKVPSLHVVAWWDAPRVPSRRRAVQNVQPQRQWSTGCRCSPLSVNDERFGFKPQHAELEKESRESARIKACSIALSGTSSCRVHPETVPQMLDQLAPTH